MEHGGQAAALPRLEEEVRCHLGGGGVRCVRGEVCGQMWDQMRGEVGVDCGVRHGVILGQ